MPKERVTCQFYHARRCSSLTVLRSPQPIIGIIRNGSRRISRNYNVDWATASKDLFALFQRPKWTTWTNRQPISLRLRDMLPAKRQPRTSLQDLRYLKMMWYSLPDERRAAAENHVSNIPDREMLAKKRWEWVQEVEAFNERKHEWTDERSTPF
jgi:hypothetical protein